jgi:hypothetical protein
VTPNGCISYEAERSYAPSLRCFDALDGFARGFPGPFVAFVNVENMLATALVMLNTFG